MDYSGRYQLGQTLHLYLQCRDGSNVPTLPDDAPWLTVLTSAGVAAKTLQMPIRDRRQVTGFFHYPLFLGDGFAAGLYSAVMTYQVSSHTGLEEVDFQILAGGDEEGHARAMHFFRRPQANFVVYGTDSGKIMKGRNPTL